jgi:hypothetical protein
VLSDSDAMCNKLMEVEKGPRSACLQMRSIFHELRAYPGKRSFMFDEFERQQCRQVPAFTTLCDGLQKALRAGTPKDCAEAGDGESICLAYLNLDASLCRMTGKMAEAEIEFPKPKAGGTAKMKVKDEAEENCRQNIEGKALLAKGLEVLAESGPPRERELAKAALGRPDACETYARAALESCVGTGGDSQVPVPPPPLAATQAPGSEPRDTKDEPQRPPS